MPLDAATLRYNGIAVLKPVDIILPIAFCNISAIPNEIYSAAIVRLELAFGRHYQATRRLMN
jgi:hypothetical protein